LNNLAHFEEAVLVTLAGETTPFRRVAGVNSALSDSSIEPQSSHEVETITSILGSRNLSQINKNKLVELPRDTLRILDYRTIFIGYNRVQQNLDTFVAAALTYQTLFGAP